MSDNTGDQSNVSALFDRYKERLRRTVRLRLDRRLTGIVDSSGVLKMAREEVERRSTEPTGTAGSSFLGLRQIVGEVLLRIHQQRLGPDVRGDISLYRGALPEATSVSLAPHLLAKGGGEDDQAAARAEQKIMLQETLNPRSGTGSVISTTVPIGAPPMRRTRKRSRSASGSRPRTRGSRGSGWPCRGRSMGWRSRRPEMRRSTRTGDRSSHG